MTLESIQKLLGLVDRFEKVERVDYKTGSEQKENDAEHSYSMMVAAWFLAKKLNAEKRRNLNIEKVLAYAMVHDLVEAYSGDTDVFHAESVATKQEREEEGLATLKKDFDFFPDLYATIHEYEEQADPEAVFVKSLDKIMPAMRNLRDNGRSFKAFQPNLLFSEWVAIKEPRIHDQDVFELFNAVKEQLHKEGYMRNE